MYIIFFGYRFNQQGYSKIRTHINITKRYGYNKTRNFTKNNKKISKDKQYIFDGKGVINNDLKKIFFNETKGKQLSIYKHLVF